MYCMECGQQLPDTAHYCFKCGAKTIKQNDATVSAQYTNDVVAAKAEDFVADDATISGVKSTTDDVASKAAFFGGNIPDSPHISETSKPKISHVNKPRYTETRKVFLADYLYEIKREDNVKNKKSYSLWNSKSIQQSEWFDKIWDEGNDIVGIRRDGKIGLMELSFRKFVLWNNLIRIQDGLYGVCTDKQWTLVITKDKVIEPLNQYSYDEIIKADKDYAIVSKNGKQSFLGFDDNTNKVFNPISCEFDSIKICNHGVFIVELNNKYGYVFYEESTKVYSYKIECLLDWASPFSTIKYDDPMAKVIYKGKQYEIDKAGCLWKSGLYWGWWFFLIDFSALLAVGGTMLYDMIVNGHSFHEAQSTEYWGIFLFLWVLCVFILWKYIEDKILIPTKINLQKK